MNKEALEELNDSELLMLFQENDENAKNLLFDKYKFIINIIIKKYSFVWEKLNLDYQDLFSECSVGFSDSLNSYSENKNVLLSTFISVCVERRVQSIIRKYSREKYQSNYSLDFIYDDKMLSLKEIVSDDHEHDPLKNITDEEDYQELFAAIQKRLTPKENEVFVLLTQGFNYREISDILQINAKNVDNTIQRIKLKVRQVLEECKI